MLGSTDRIRRVKRMLRILRSEKIEPDKSDIFLIQAYIDKSISLNDLILHAMQFSTEASYKKWICDKSKIDDDKSQISNLDDQFIEELQDQIRRKRASQ